MPSKTIITVNCASCGKPFQTLKKGRQTSGTCSKECRYASVSRALVGNKNADGWPKGKPRPNMVGEKHPQWKEKIAFTCAHCGGAFHKPAWQTRGSGRTNEFCSVSCRATFRHLHRSGENAPDYVGGPQTYRGRGWLKARSAVVTAQNGDCARCGLHVGKSLPVHHRRPFRMFSSAEEANRPENLIGLRQPCHMKEEHSKPPPH